MIILGGFTHFYPRPCLHGLGYCRGLCRLSVCLSVRLAVRLSVCPSVQHPCVQDYSRYMTPRLTKFSHILCHATMSDEFEFQKNPATLSATFFTFLPIFGLTFQVIEHMNIA